MKAVPMRRSAMRPPLMKKTAAVVCAVLAGLAIAPAGVAQTRAAVAMGAPARDLGCAAAAMGGQGVCAYVLQSPGGSQWFRLNNLTFASQPHTLAALTARTL